MHCQLPTTFLITLTLCTLSHANSTSPCLPVPPIPAAPQDLTPIPTLTPFNSSHILPLNITHTQVETLAPFTSSCSTPIYPVSECSNSTAVAAGINYSTKKYSIMSLGARAAVISLMSHESDSFRANTQHPSGSPMLLGNAGQGSKAMLPFPNLFRFVLGMGFGPTVSSLLMQDADLLLYLDAEGLSAALASIPDDLKNRIRGLVLGDEYTFQAAAWYLRNRCSKDIYKGLKLDGYDGLKAYIEDPECIGVAIDEDRKRRWCLAVEALKPEDMAIPVECAGAEYD